MKIVVCINVVDLLGRYLSIFLFTFNCMTNQPLFKTNDCYTRCIGVVGFEFRMTCVILDTLIKNSKGIALAHKEVEIRTSKQRP